MKLTLGENIRKLRRKREMTQEQLADRLGVTYQSVSRWENCTAYPDMELLPAISDIFSVSVDELLGIPESEKEKQAAALLDEFVCTLYDGHEDTEEANLKNREQLAEIIKKFRRDYAGTEAASDFWTGGLEHYLMKEPLLSECRLFAEAMLEKNPNNFSVISTFSIIESDERIDSFLDRFSTPCDRSRSTLLLERYSARENLDKYEPLRQKKLYEAVKSAVDFKTNVNAKKRWDLKETSDVLKTCLDIIHTFEGETSTTEHPITCDGKPDCWFFEKVWHGLRLSCRMATLGRTDEAFAMLKDVTELLENAVNLPEGAEIKKSRFLPDLEWKKETSQYDWDTGLYFKSDPSGCWTQPFSPSDVFNALTAEHGWEWFDLIRNDPRYQVYVERVKALIRSK